MNISIYFPQLSQAGLSDLRSRAHSTATETPQTPENREKSYKKKMFWGFFFFF